MITNYYHTVKFCHLSSAQSLFTLQLSLHYVMFVPISSLCSADPQKSDSKTRPWIRSNSIKSAWSFVDRPQWRARRPSLCLSARQLRVSTEYDPCSPQPRARDFLPACTPNTHLSRKPPPPTSLPPWSGRRFVVVVIHLIVALRANLFESEHERETPVGVTLFIFFNIDLIFCA